MRDREREGETERGNRKGKIRRYINQRETEKEDKDKI